jgi:hypothetical protein
LSFMKCGSEVKAMYRALLPSPPPVISVSVNIG